MNLLNIYEDIKEYVNSDNEHELVVGTSYFNGDSLKLHKIEYEPFIVRWDKTVFVEPYEWGFEDDKVQEEYCILGLKNDLLVCDLLVKSNVKNPLMNFYANDLIDISKFNDYYVCLSTNGKKFKIDPRSFRFMDGFGLLDKLSFYLNT